MWTAASSKVVACYYAHATRTVYRLEQHNPRSPTSTRVDERQQGPELSQRSGLELDGRHGSLRHQARSQGPGNAMLFRSRSVSNLECPKPPEFGSAGPNWSVIGWQ